MGDALVKKLEELVALVGKLDGAQQVDALNTIRTRLHEIGPFAQEPVDCVLWKRADSVEANDYNPNTVAPPEMKLLVHSIRADGYTQPVVAWHTKKERYEVVDGFHRSRVGREDAVVKERVQGYLPITVVNNARGKRGDRIAATIRHNRARGKHGVLAMSDIVQELARLSWKDAQIAEELGMDADEVLRLKQITGLAEAFADREFSTAWEAVDDDAVD